MVDNKQPPSNQEVMVDLNNRIVHLASTTKSFEEMTAWLYEITETLFTNKNGDDKLKGGYLG